MGTRNSTIIRVDNEIKVAQYCQWDGYPNGQGRTIVGFLRRANLKKFKEMVRGVVAYKGIETRKIWNDAGADEKSDWVSSDVAAKVKETNPELSRDTGAKILSLIQKGLVKKVIKQLAWAKSGFDCEWAYVIDLDTNTLEVYYGNYKKANLLKSYKLSKLPEPKVFVKQCEALKEKQDGVTA